MTVAPQTPPLIFHSVEDAIRAVRERGMRLSTPRRLVLEALFGAEGPISAVHLARTLAIDVTSAYRNLEMLERYGLIRHVHLGHGPGLYVLVGRHEVEYLYCERCAKVTPVSPDQLDPVRDQVRASFGYEASFSHFPIVGLCRSCASDRADEVDGPLRAPDVGPGHMHSGDEEAQPPASPEHVHSHGDYLHAHSRGRSH